jgi:hypothetical protein
MCNIEFDTSVQSCHELASRICELGRYKKYLIVRDPLERYLSFYINWIIEKEPTFVDKQGNLNHGFRILKEVISKEAYAQFTNLTSFERRTAESINFYTCYLNKFYMKDAHTQPQSLIYAKKGMQIDIFDKVVPIKKLNTFIRQLFGVEIPVLNRTKHKKVNLRTKYVELICKSVYKSDYEDFGEVLI